MKTRIITTEEEFLALKEDWNSVLRESQNDVVNLSHEWTASWWKSFGGGADLHIIVVYGDNGKIIGIAPMMSSTGIYRWFGVRKISLMVNGHSPCGDIIAVKGALGEVTRSVFESLASTPGWDIIELVKIDSGGPTYEAILDRLAGGPATFGVYDNIETPYVPIDSAWEEFMSKRGKRFKKSLRNKINRAGRDGEIRVENVPLTSSSNGVFADIMKVSEESWKKRIKADMSTNSHNRVFYRSLADSLGAQGHASVWLLKKAGEPIAFELHITYNGVVYPIRADYSRGFKELSPGSVLEYNILKSLFNGSSVKEYNTCGHSYHYLMNWTDRTRKYRNIEIFRSGMRPYCLFLLEYTLMPVLRKVKPEFINGIQRSRLERIK